MRRGYVAVCLIGLSVAAAGEARADDDTLALDLGGLTLEARRVTHGSFIQGSPAAEPGHQPDEEPARQVTISKDFWIGKYPVTRAQFAKFVADTRYVTDAEKGQVGGSGWDGKQLTQKKEFSWRSPGFTQTDEHPVVMVSYGDANAFVGWATRKSGKRVRLPTEAEWEYSARGGANTAWYGGSTEVEALTLGWFKPNAGNGTRPVGQKKPNVLGVFDMAGDVFEWCRDVYAPYKEGAVVDPESVATSAEPERRVLRGGSWLRDPKRGRSGARHKNAPGSRNADNGFRVVVTADETVAPGVTGTPPDFAPQAPVALAGSSGSSGSGAASSGASGSAGPGPLTGGDAASLATASPGSAASQGSEAFSWGILLASPLAAASAAVAWMLLRRRRVPAGTGVVAGVGAGSVARAAGVARTTTSVTRPAPRAPAITTRADTDGFYVLAPDVVPGTRVRYDCVVDGKDLSDIVPLDGQETFVYTGSSPTAVRILGSIAPGPAAAPLRPDATPPRAPPPVPMRAPPPPPSSPRPSARDPLAPPSSSAPLLPPSSPSPPSSRPSVPPAPPSSRPSAPPPVPSKPPPLPSSRPMVPPSPPSSRPSAPPAPPSSRPSAPNPFLVPFVDPSPSSGSLPTASPPPVAPAPPPSSPSSSSSSSSSPPPPSPSPSPPPEAFDGHPRAY